MQLTATHCNTLQHAATHWASFGLGFYSFTPSQRQHTRQHTATHCKTLQHTATHYNTLQRGLSRVFIVSICHYTPGNSLQHIEQYCNALQHAATYCNIAWARFYCLTPVTTQTVIRCNTLQFGISCLALSPSKRAHVCCFSSLPLATPFFLSTYMYVCICLHI